MGIWIKLYFGNWKVGSSSYRRQIDTCFLTEEPQLSFCNFYGKVSWIFPFYVSRSLLKYQKVMVSLSVTWTEDSEIKTNYVVDIIALYCKVFVSWLRDLCLVNVLFTRVWFSLNSQDLKMRATITSTVKIWISAQHLLRVRMQEASWEIFKSWISARIA